MQMLGGIGYTTVYPVERLLRDSRLGLIWTGSSYVVAIGLLKEGVRILSWLNIQDRSSIKIGMKMKLKAVKRKEGYYSYEFFSI